MTRYADAVATLTKRVGDDGDWVVANGKVTEITIYLEMLQELTDKVIAGTATITTHRIIIKVLTKLDEMAEWAESNA
jgi:hypothetical protein